MNIGVLCVLKDWQALYIIHWHNEQYRKKMFSVHFLMGKSRVLSTEKLASLVLVYQLELVA
jgi:hypothetical protein